MHIKLIGKFQVSKSGDKSEDCEDKIGLPKGDKIWRGRTFRCALADGATESAYSGEWAKLLVSAFVHKEPLHSYISPTSEDLSKIVSTYARVWSDTVHNKPLPWFVIEKIQFGAFSTFLGLFINNQIFTFNRSHSWVAVAVGDTCLFQVRSDTLTQNVIGKFPLEHSLQFNNRPVLISTQPANNQIVFGAGRIKYEMGTWQSSDRFYLMTDALAKWFLEQDEKGQQPWRELDKLSQSKSPEHYFQEWLEQLRTHRSIRNDDVTLLVLEVTE